MIYNKKSWVFICGTVACLSFIIGAVSMAQISHLPAIKAEMLEFFHSQTEKPSVSVNHVVSKYIFIGMDQDIAFQILKDASFEITKLPENKVVSKKEQGADIDELYSFYYEAGFVTKTSWGIILGTKNHKINYMDSAVGIKSL